MDVDGEGVIVGRLAAFCAKQALKGERVNVFNVGGSVFSVSNPKVLFTKYLKRRGVQNKADPEKSPKWPRRPDFLFKKIVSGMLPKGRRGREALKRVKVFLAKGGVKPNLKNAGSIKIKTVTLEELCEKLGWEGV
jgi:large subunit ribosomal protein L13